MKNEVHFSWDIIIEKTLARTPKKWSFSFPCSWSLTFTHSLGYFVLIVHKEMVIMLQTLAYVTDRHTHSVS